MFVVSEFMREPQDRFSFAIGSGNGDNLRPRKRVKKRLQGFSHSSEPWPKLLLAVMLKKPLNNVFSHGSRSKHLTKKAQLFFKIFTMDNPINKSVIF